MSENELYLKCLDCRNNRNRTPPSLFLLGFAWLRMISVVFKEKRVPMHKFLLFMMFKKTVFGVWWLLATVWSLWLNLRSWTVWICGQRQQIYSHNGRNITVKTQKNFLTCLCLFYYTKRFTSWGLPSCVGYQNLRHSSDNDLLGLDSQNLRKIFYKVLKIF